MAINPPAISFVLAYQVGRYTFSERHYLVSATSVLQNSASLQALAFAALRNFLLGSGATLLAIELHDDRNLRTTAEVTLPPAPPAGVAYNPTYVAYVTGEGAKGDFAFSDLMCRKEGNEDGSPIVYHSNYFIACNPDVIQQADLFPPSDALWNAAFQAFRLGAFRAGGGGTNPFGMKVLSRDTGSSPVYPVTSVTVNNNNAFVYTVQGSTGWAANTQVSIRGVKGTIPSSVNGKRTISAITGGNVLTVNFPFAPAGWSYKGGGTVQARAYTVVPYSNLIMQRFTHRKRGATLFGVRGRKFAHRSTST